VNDTTSTPEESDGRAGVTTGKQAGSAGPAGAAASDFPTASAANSANEPEAAGPTRPSDGMAAGAKPSGDQQAAAGASIGKAPAGKAPAGNTPAGNTPAGNTPAENTPAENTPAEKDSAGKAPVGKVSAGPASADQVTAETTTSEKGPAVSNGRLAAKPPSPAAGAPFGAPDAPTARIRMPKDTNGSAPTSPSIPRPQVNGPAPTGQDRSTPPQPAEPVPAFASSVAAPTPASGPVPHPGPAAASPPPWNRVPGQTPAAAGKSAPRQSGPAGGLLDDGPTAYLMPDAAPTTGPTDPQSGRNWSPVRSGRSRPPRQAALQLKRLDPWSMLKLGLVLAVVIFFIWLVAVGVLYGVLDGMGVWDRLNGTYADLVSGEAPTGSPLISAGRVFGLAAVIGAINSLLFAVAVTIGAFVYNVSADLVGGVEVTLSERD
jgi:Transmembrane domain of unknown function (DUF3566)